MFLSVYDVCHKTSCFIHPVQIPVLTESSILRVKNVCFFFLTSVFAFLQMNCFILYSEASYTYFSNKVIDFDLWLFLIFVLNKVVEVLTFISALFKSVLSFSCN